MSFNFNEVEQVEAIKLPEMVQNEVFKNQTDLIDPMVIKSLTSLVIGAGSVGSNLIHTMNKFGFSSFIVYDYDIWEEHNSASSLYPYKRASELKPKCDRNSEDWTYYPAPFNKEGGTLGEPNYSIFKVDLLDEEISRNDPNTYFEKYRMPFGEKTEVAFTKFNQSVVKMNAKQYFTNDGRYNRRSSSNAYEFDWSPKAKPDLMILTTDSLVSRAKSVWNMRILLKEKYKHSDRFVVIDTRTLDSTKGEILIFDLLNDEELFDWFNYSIPVSKREKSFKDLESKIGDNLEAIEDIPFINGTPNQCGNKMSILISSQISLLTTNIIVNLYSGKVEWENFPRLYLMNTSPIVPYISKMEKMLNE